jgi:CCR4-NOT transcriptional regulation complex NOT5 subunit
MGELSSTQNDGLVFRSKMLWALGNYSRFIRPGMIRVEASLENNTNPQVAAANLMLSAFKNTVTKEIVVVVINMTGKDEKIKLNGISFSNSALKTYTTSATKEMKYAEAVASDKLTIGARSIVTFIGKY